jgi:hypothetical protein
MAIFSRKGLAMQEVTIEQKLDAKAPTKHFNQTCENIKLATAFQPSKIT